MNLMSILEDAGLLVGDVTVADLCFDFTKRGRYHEMNALQNDVSGEYIVTIEHDGSNWVVFAEEHEPEDLVEMGCKATHKTLWAAKEAASKFARFFQDCVWQNQRDEDEDA